jgi:Fe-S-cluster containining protein
VYCLNDDLPAIYRQFLPAVFNQPIPQETEATCASCAMCLKPGEDKIEGLNYYRDGLKCCTYHPDIPNYLVGAILADKRPELAEGQRRIKAKIQALEGVLPQGISRTEVYRERFENKLYEDFGNDLKLLCPYLKDGDCTIWPWREAICSTYFCRFVAGKDGELLWLAVRKYLIAAERILIDYCTRDLALTGPEINPYFETQRPPAEVAAEVWGEHIDQIEQFYIQCWEAIQTLDARGYRSIAEPQTFLAKIELETAVNRVNNPVLPELLEMNTELKAWQEGDNAQLLTREGVVELPMKAIESLQLFDGKRDTATVTSLSTVKLPQDLLIKLWRLDILKAPSN